MKIGLRNPWVLTLCVILVGGTVATPWLMKLSSDFTAIQYTGAVAAEPNYLDTVTLNTVGLPLVLALTAGSAIALLALAALERMRQAHSARTPQRTA